MRLKIKLKANNLNLPFSYNHFIQAAIYGMLSKKDVGDFYHNKGYEIEGKHFKMFVFSSLLGKYEIVNKRILFNDEITFYISSLDNEFIQYIYEYISVNPALFIAKQMVEIKDVEIEELPYFKNTKILTIKTLSPIICASKKEDFVHYYKPTDEEFSQLVIQNIKNKILAYKYPINEIVFNIKKVEFENRRIVKFKQTTYEAYLTHMNVELNYDTLKLLYDTGIAMKGPCGFGMIYALTNEENNLSV